MLGREDIVGALTGMQEDMEIIHDNLCEELQEKLSNLDESKAKLIVQELLKDLNEANEELFDKIFQLINEIKPLD